MEQKTVLKIAGGIALVVVNGIGFGVAYTKGLEKGMEVTLATTLFKPEHAKMLYKDPVGKVVYEYINKKKDKVSMEIGKKLVELGVDFGKEYSELAQEEK